eukprot:CAMPEP_0115053926 /NCGR_PEP_ID=MMETSP0227-20121206/3800_1 /TAXON_ID=89957 /ORGANISM="Polarella glacialis, Strain CCMP 1383" /LENGTH=103 /DNA_ID=CAMNT_0002438325 /DNA_START=2830 /DNA_END=3142 /DNA_ORIENTATION=-
MTAIAGTAAASYGTSVPVESDGHGTATQEPRKKGGVKDARILPLKPPWQLQPAGTLTPSEFAGQATAWQDKTPAVKTGLKPFSQFASAGRSPVGLYTIPQWPE